MLVYAAEANKIRVVELLLKQTELDVNAVDSQLNTALVYSAWKGNDEIVSMLLQHPNVEVDFRGLGAYTAIASAVEGGFAGQIQQCIDAGGRAAKNSILPTSGPTRTIRLGARRRAWRTMGSRSSASSCWSPTAAIMTSFTS